MDLVEKQDAFDATVKEEGISQSLVMFGLSIWRRKHELEYAHAPSQEVEQMQLAMDIIDDAFAKIRILGIR